jgi:hypothetical protein
LPAEAPLKPIGKGISVLLIDDMAEKIPIFENAFMRKKIQARLVLCLTLRDARDAIMRQNETGRPFNAVLLDKTGFAEEAIDLVATTSPKSRICIQSAEDGPGRFAGFHFIDILDRLEVVAGRVRKFMEKVDREPYLKEPQKISLASLRRPIAIRDLGGHIWVHYFVENGPLPKEAQELLSEGGKILNLNEALEAGLGEFARRGDRSALFIEQERIEQRIARAATQSRTSGRKPSNGMPHKDTFHRLPQRRHALR